MSDNDDEEPRFPGAWLRAPLADEPAEPDLGWQPEPVGKGRAVYYDTPTNRRTTRGNVVQRTRATAYLAYPDLVR